MQGVWRPGRAERGSERLRHHDAVRLQAISKRVRIDEWLGAGFDVAVTAIHRRQLGSQAEDGDIGGHAALASEMVFGGLHHAPADSGALARGIDREHANVAAFVADLDIDGTNELAGVVFGEEDCAFFERGGEALGIRARAGHEGLDGEGLVDERYEPVAVCGHRNPNR
jgi:hypothetical protein